MLGLSKKTAWFLCHRIRESLRETSPEPMGGEGKTVEFDETFIGGKERNKHASKRNKKNIGSTGKEAVFSLVERGGKVRSHHVADISAKTLRPILNAQIKDDTKTMSDDGGSRPRHGSPHHHSVNHSIGEYVRGDVHTNTIEGYFSIMKRGITGTYHHVSQQQVSPPVSREALLICRSRPDSYCRSNLPMVRVRCASLSDQQHALHVSPARVAQRASPKSRATFWSVTALDSTSECIPDRFRRILSERACRSLWRQQYKVLETKQKSYKLECGCGYLIHAERGRRQFSLFLVIASPIFAQQSVECLLAR